MQLCKQIILFNYFNFNAANNYAWYMHKHTYIHIHIHLYIDLLAHNNYQKRLYIRVITLMCEYFHSYRHTIHAYNTHIHFNTYTHTHTRTHKHTYAHSLCARTHINSYACTYIHAHYTYTYIDTRCMLY